MAHNPLVTKVAGLRIKSLLTGHLTRFARSDMGLVTLEWVALSAGVVIMAIIIGVTLMDGLQDPAVAIGEQLTVPAPP